ncbi:hypothetical protein F5878DRAFT_94550 [Lentinula raphanica]|uniref:LisH domain-containing protein n=1 Tax=Lentinula raphanica TaxID=153919 RepID=A0AA38PC28_9AGAR|nr:hypothetical protein F5878DRAFT_94550 [Lentinula raphanica]
MSNASQPGPSHSSAQSDPNYSQSPLSWEGDRMFNIYIYDYCFKRGFRKTARELLIEADLPAESQPPINAKQGLLFEWWSVFWVLFTAKANGNGSDDALTYTNVCFPILLFSLTLLHNCLQYQAAQNNIRSRSQQLPPPGQPRPNGLPLPANRPFPATGPMTNGGPPNFPPVPHVNGIPPQQPLAGPQRTSIVGRGSTGGGPPFPSPTMANSPHNPGQPPMNIGQSPHLNPRMVPPSTNGIHQGPGHLPGSYPTNRPPSRTASPGQMGGMMHSSPAMNSRMVPHDPRGSQDPFSVELQGLPPQVLNGLREELGLPGKDIRNMTMDERQRLHSLYRQKGLGRKSGPINAAAGPSTMHPPQRRVGKRNSTSPREDPDNVPGTGSPPTKKPRRSPVDPPSSYPPHGPQPGQAPGSQPGSSMGPPGVPGSGPGPGPLIIGGMRSSMPPPPGGPGGSINVNGFGPPMGGGAGAGGMGGIGMSSSAPPHPMNAMSPPMSGGMPSRSGMMTPQMQSIGRPPSMDGPSQYRASLATFHNQQLGAGGGAGSPSDPSFGPGPGPGPGPNNRIPKHGPPGVSMPPPSPGMNKDGSVKDMHKLDGSPRGGPPPPSSAGMTPNASGNGPGPGGHSSTPAPPRPPSSQNPPPNSGLNPGGPPPLPPNMDPSPGSMLGNNSMPGSMSGLPNGVGGLGPSMVGLNSGMNPMTGMGTDMFLGSEFMNEIGNLEFDTNLFQASGGDLNFERDFGQWFNPNDQALEDPLDTMK